MRRRKVLFLTGTRADYGKMKPLMKAVDAHPAFACHIFVTGMHTLQAFGDTKTEIMKDGFSNLHVYMNQIAEEPMDLVLANTINGFSRYIRELQPDLIVLHGDRVEALAGAISGAFNNILVGHIEGGEVSGTIDESIRHSISKLAHIHFVSNQDAQKRLLQLGENESAIYVIGSPDIDILLGPPAMSIEDVKERYEVPFDEYGILIYHPVTTKVNALRKASRAVVEAVIASGKNYIVINPNNDFGHHIIMEEYEAFSGHDQILRFPSIRFEYFVELLRHSAFILGNSSTGIHEAPVLGIKSINVGSRQDNRFAYESIYNVPEEKDEILGAIRTALQASPVAKTTYFGQGDSSKRFMDLLSSEDFWITDRQKKFYDR